MAPTNFAKNPNKKGSSSICVAVHRLLAAMPVRASHANEIKMVARSGYQSARCFTQRGWQLDFVRLRGAVRDLP
jgi:hypothetical protein